MSIGADTALNVAVQAVDRIKASATADPRVFVVETMGRSCDFLALATGVATGAERVWLNAEGITLAGLAEDVDRMRADFAGGQDLWLAIRSPEASATHTLDRLTAAFADEAGGAFSVREAVLGHVQQGGRPSPFDRINAVRLAGGVMDWLDAERAAGGASHVYALPDGVAPVDELPGLLDLGTEQVRDPWWDGLRGVLTDLGRRPSAAVGGGEASG